MIQRIRSILSEIVEFQFEASRDITLLLVTIMFTQGKAVLNKNEVNEIKRKFMSEQEVRILEQALKVKQDQTPHALKAIQDAKIPGGSLWLSVLPLTEFCFALNKDKFKDALILRYGRPLKSLSAMCPCVEKYNLTHALDCKKGGFVTMRHNNLKDFEADMLSKIVNDVETEPELQPLQVRLLKDYLEMLEDPILEREVCGEPVRSYFLMLW